MAIEEELLTFNPTFKLGKLIGKLKKQKPGKEISPFSREESVLLLDTALKHFPRFLSCFIMFLTYRNEDRRGVRA